MELKSVTNEWASSIVLRAPLSSDIPTWYAEFLVACRFKIYEVALSVMQRVLKRLRTP